MRAFIIMFVASFCLASSVDLQADRERGGNFSSAKSFGRQIKEGKLRENASKAVDVIINKSLYELKQRGATILAERISYEYETTYRNLFTSRNIGDHEGVVWLLKIHSDIEFVIGETICRSLRLHDLWVLGYTIPVVFACEDAVDGIEYFLHLDPFCGIVSYWLTWGGCTGATMGAGAITFICGLVGMGVEQIVTLFVVPPLSDSVWKIACKK